MIRSTIPYVCTSGGSKAGCKNSRTPVTRWWGAWANPNYRLLASAHQNSNLGTPETGAPLDFFQPPPFVHCGGWILFSNQNFSQVQPVIRTFPTKLPMNLVSFLTFRKEIKEAKVRSAYPSNSTKLRNELWPACFLVVDGWRAQEIHEICHYFGIGSTFEIEGKIFHL